MNLNRLVNHRWFALADLICVVAAIVLWVVYPQLSWRPVLIALLPWSLRLLAGRFPFRRTRYDLAIVIFLVTAVTARWAAYDQELAWGKFWLLMGGIFLFYALAGQPGSNLWIISGFVSAAGTGMAVFFLLTHNWEEFPTKVAAFQGVAQLWMQIRPDLQVGATHSNNAGGFIALMTPFLVAVVLHTLLQKRILPGLLLILAGGLTVAGLLLTSSRGAWLALTAALGVWLAWEFSGRLARRLPWQQNRIFGVTLILSACLATGLATQFPGGIIGLVNQLPGPHSAGGRLSLAQDALQIVADFPFTGGGLGAFPGLHAHYIEGVPYFTTLYSHNVFLDVALEQGVFGLLAFSIIYLSSLWSLLTYISATPNSGFAQAALASLVVIFIHGLVDNIIYNPELCPLVFFLPGMIRAIIRSGQEKNQDHPLEYDKSPAVFQGNSTSRRVLWGIGLIAIILLTLAYSFRQLWLSAWYANLGAVEMARVELADFPSWEWAYSREAKILAQPEELFTLARRYDPQNRTANHRLGMIAMLRRDFPAAVAYLEIAYRTGKTHTGIRKALGYGYVWNGQSELAIPVLAGISDADYDLYKYARWWASQGRQDLYDQAESMRVRMKTGDAVVP